MERLNLLEDRMRIIQEIVPGKQVTLAHIIAHPDEAIYEKMGKEKEENFGYAMGIMTMSPSESVIIAGDLATKSATVKLMVLDYDKGTLMIKGKVSEVEEAIRSIAYYCEKTLDFTVCEVTKS